MALFNPNVFGYPTFNSASSPAPVVSPVSSRRQPQPQPAVGSIHYISKPHQARIDGVSSDERLVLAYLLGVTQ